MRTPISDEAARIVADEQQIHDRVQTLVSATRAVETGTNIDLEADLLSLRDQIAEEKEEDLPVLVEHMTRLQALAGRRAKVRGAIDADSPYFAHLRLRAGVRHGGKESDILIGRRGLIDRAAGVQIVDWRDAPISQIYYRYEEGDDYDDQFGSAHLDGTVLARRNVTIAGGKLRRIGCPQGTFAASHDGRWFDLTDEGVALLEGGEGSAARPPRPQPQPKNQTKGRRREVARTGDKHLPEIAALIDPQQWALVTQPATGLVVIQGGAGSGKTTVALHRIAYLLFHHSNMRPSHCMFVVPSAALSRYVSGVLPALGVRGVVVTTFRSWIRSLRKRLVPNAPDRYADETPPAVARLKKHTAWTSLLKHAVDEEMARARQLLATRMTPLADGDRVLRLWDRLDASPVTLVRKLTKELQQSSLAATTNHVADLTLRQISARLKDVRQILFELLTDRSRLAPLRTTAHEPASAGEIEELVKWSSAQLEEALPKEARGIDAERLAPVDGLPSDHGDSPLEIAQGRLDEEDDTLLVRLYQLLYGQLPRVDGAPLIYDHIAIDEAQDLSAIDVSLLYHATDERHSVTIAGDTAQRVIFDNGFIGWAELLAAAEIAAEAHRVRPLKLAYRSTAQVMQFANRLLADGSDAGEADAAGGRPGAEVALYRFLGMGEAVAMISEALRSLLAREPSASVALIARHPGQGDAWFQALRRAEVPHLRRVVQQDFTFNPGIDVTEVTQVKGLEFDYVILLDVNESSYPDSVESRHLLHIGATRATHQLWLIATGPLSPPVAQLKDCLRVGLSP